MSIGIVGSGAFGTALAIAMASDGTKTRLWGRDAAQIDAMARTRRNQKYLPDIAFPEALRPTCRLSDLADVSCVLLVLPAQKTAEFWQQNSHIFSGKSLILCAKGISTDSLKLQSEICPECSGVLTGPGFASEIAAGKPTALTLALPDPKAHLQALLSRPRLRLYRTTDMIGAQIGGALKNVIAIAAGIAIGAGLGESARAAIMTRGFAEMRRLALRLGAADATLSGLSGLGDLALTCASEKSRNFAHGVALGQGRPPAATTVEGVATAKATIRLAKRHKVEMPVAQAVGSVLEGEKAVTDAIQDLLARPLREE